MEFLILSDCSGDRSRVVAGFSRVGYFLVVTANIIIRLLFIRRSDVWLCVLADMMNMV
jgi:hypothetical protein